MVRVKVVDARDARLNAGDKTQTAKRSKIKDLVPVEARISLFQTSMNNAGRNFQGKRVKVAVMAKFASAFYKLSIKEIEGIGRLSIKQIAQTFEKEPVKKKTKRAKLNKLMLKAKKLNGHGKHKAKNKKKKKKTAKKRKGKK